MDSKAYSDCARSREQQLRGWKSVNSRLFSACYDDGTLRRALSVPERKRKWPVAVHRITAFITGRGSAGTLPSGEQAALSICADHARYSLVRGVFAVFLLLPGSWPTSVIQKLLMADWGKRRNRQCDMRHPAITRLFRELRFNAARPTAPLGCAVARCRTQNTLIKHQQTSTRAGTAV